MTMQTTTLPFQVSGASALAQPPRNAAAGVQAPMGEQFSATLSRAMAPTMAPTRAPAPAAPSSKPAAPAKQADKPAAQGPKPAAREPANQNEAASEAPATAAAESAAADATESSDPAKDARTAAEAASTPVTDMLAFMAALTQAPAAPTTAAGDAGLQLTALQSAFAKLETTDATAAATDPLAATADDAAGFSLASGVQPTAQESADLRAQQQTTQALVPAEPGKAQAQLRGSAADTAASLEAPAPSVTQLQAQAAKLDTLPNPAAMAGDRIPARVGSQAWDNQVSQRIVYMVGKEQAATLTLNPPDLGPVQVILNVSNDQASVSFSSNQLEVRQALENALPRLREMMGESGIALGNATVDAGMPDGRQGQQDGERRHGGSGGFGNAGGTVAATDDSAARPATRTVHLGDNGLVDTFA